jgi:hypothetical protein
MAGTTPGHDESLFLDDRVVEIIPVRIIRQDQPDFPFSRPMLDVVLALDRQPNVVVLLEVDEAFDGVA